MAQIYNINIQNDFDLPAELRPSNYIHLQALPSLITNTNLICLPIYITRDILIQCIHQIFVTCPIAPPNSFRPTDRTTASHLTTLVDPIKDIYERLSQFQIDFSIKRYTESQVHPPYTVTHVIHKPISDPPFRPTDRTTASHLTSVL